jgi:hypothetical protein
MRVSRPRFKGRTIGLQLPLSVDAEVRRRAELAGVSPGVWIADRLTRSMGADATGGVVRALRPVRDESNTRTPTEEEAVRERHPSSKACAHSVKMPIAGGLSKCRSCEMVRGADGVWR